jgi:single-stranded DNA-binding protein
VSIYTLVSGPLIGDPQRRTGAKGPFITATIRTSGEEAVFVSVIAFGDEAERLLEFVKGDALAIAGRARLTSWTGRDGVEKRGISVVAEQIAAAKPRPRSDARSHTPRAAGGARARSVARTIYSPNPAHAAPDLPSDRVDDLWPESAP